MDTATRALLFLMVGVALIVSGYLVVSRQTRTERRAAGVVILVAGGLVAAYGMLGVLVAGVF